MPAGMLDDVVEVLDWRSSMSAPQSARMASIQAALYGGVCRPYLVLGHCTATDAQFPLLAASRFHERHCPMDFLHSLGPNAGAGRSPNGIRNIQWLRLDES